MSTKINSTVRLPLTRETAAGVAVTGSVIGDFSVTLEHNGATYSPSLSLNEIGSGAYEIIFAAPSTIGNLSVFVDVASGTDYLSVGSAHYKITETDTDTLQGLINAGTAVIVPGQLSSGDLGEAVELDTDWRSPVLEVPLETLERIGESDLSNVGAGTNDVYLLAGAMQGPDETSVQLAVSVVDAAARTVRVVWPLSGGNRPWPTGLNLAAGEDYADWQVDVQVLKGSGSPYQIQTAGRYSLRVLSERETRTAP